MAAKSTGIDTKENCVTAALSINRSTLFQTNKQENSSNEAEDSDIV